MVQSMLDKKPRVGTRRWDCWPQLFSQVWQKLLLNWAEMLKFAALSVVINNYWKGGKFAYGNFFAYTFFISLDMKRKISEQKISLNLEMQNCNSCSTAVDCIILTRAVHYGRNRSLLLSFCFEILQWWSTSEIRSITFGLGQYQTKLLVSDEFWIIIIIIILLYNFDLSFWRCSSGITFAFNSILFYFSKLQQELQNKKKQEDKHVCTLSVSFQLGFLMCNVFMTFFSLKNWPLEACNVE